MSSMRERFAQTAVEILESDPLSALVLADISADYFKDVAARFPERVTNVGIREQLLVSVAGGLALAGMRPIVHSYATFAVSRAYEQLKLDLTHQDVSAVVVSIGASYDSSAAGTTHFAPEDIELFDTLPGWQVHVPAYVDEVSSLLRGAVRDGGRHYIRLAAQPATRQPAPREQTSSRRAARAVVVAVGPTIANVRAATAQLDVEVLPMTTVRPFDGSALRRAIVELRGQAEVVLVEPYLTGTSAHEVAAALVGVPHRLLSLGVGRIDLRRYGTPDQHDAAHGLDADGLRVSIAQFLVSPAAYKMADGE
jgi:transketolase